MCRKDEVSLELDKSNRITRSASGQVVERQAVTAVRNIIELASYHRIYIWIFSFSTKTLETYTLTTYDRTLNLNWALHSDRLTGRSIREREDIPENKR